MGGLTFENMNPRDVCRLYDDGRQLSVVRGNVAIRVNIERIERVGTPLGDAYRKASAALDRAET